MYAVVLSIATPTTGQEKDINGAHYGRDSIKGDPQNESETFSWAKNKIENVFKY